MKSIYVLLIALVACTFSCRTKNGEPGPAGESSLTKQGTISGVVKFRDVKGDSQSFPFNYEYFESLDDSKYRIITYDTMNSFEAKFDRVALKDNDNYAAFQLIGYKFKNNIISLNSRDFTFSIQKIIGNLLYNFSCYKDNDLSVSNVKFDETTGRLTFEYVSEGAITYGSGNETAIVAGNVDVVLNKSIKYIITE